MKKIITISLTVLAVLFFCSCTKQGTQQNTSAPQTEQTEESHFIASTTEKTTTAAPTTLNSTKSTSAVTNLTTQQHSTTSPQTTSSATSTAQDDSIITVTVFCSCKNAVNYGIRDKKDFAEFIPENGLLFSATVTVKKGSTAMEAIKAAALESGVEIKETRGYIRAIGSLAEKDCGGASGWMYSVNGTFPNVSSDKYQLNNNDKIELHYTVNFGDVK